VKVGARALIALDYQSKADNHSNEGRSNSPEARFGLIIISKSFKVLV